MTTAATSTNPLYDAADSGVLLVYSDPGSQATTDEFHDWYDNEHVPLRTSRFDLFRSAARYSVPTSTLSPSLSSRPAFSAKWSALYTIASNALYNDAAYAALRSNRSPREAELLSRVETLDRRIYRTLFDSQAKGGEDITLSGAPHATSELSPRRAAVQGSSPSHSVLAHSISFTTDVDEAASHKAFAEWFHASALPQLKALDGFTRARRFQLVDALINGLKAEPANADGKRVPKFLLLLEFSTQTVPTSALEVLTPPQSIKERVGSEETRLMELYREWDPDAALKAE